MRELSEHDKALIIDGIPDANLVLFCPGLQGHGATLIDHSSNNLNKTMTNPDRARLARGGYALVPNTHITWGNPSHLQITNNLSLLLWVKTTPTWLSYGQWTEYALISKWTSTGNQRSWRLCLVNPLSGTLPLKYLCLKLGHATTGAELYLGYYATPLAASTWYHVGFTFASGAVTVYVNGAAVSLSTRSGQSTPPATLFNSSAGLGIRGATDYTLHPWAIPEISSGSPVLTAAQVLRVYTRQRHLFGV